MSPTTAVIGGGISGLASALRLAGPGSPVTLFESEEFLGGLATTFPYRGGHLERFYHCVLPHDRALVALIGELGLGSELLWRQTAMGFMYQGRIYPLNTALDLLRFAPLSFVERLRMGLMGLQAGRDGMNRDLDEITAADWVRRKAGARAFEILWKPLLSAKIGDHYPALPALWLSSRMSREKKTTTEVKGCLRNGYRSLIDAFERRLRERGVALRFRARVEAIEREGSHMVLRLEGGAREPFDRVIATSPLPQFQRMTRGLGLDPKIASLALDYQGVVSGVFLLEKPLTRYYWMPFVDSGTTAQGMIEMSNLVPLERSGGRYVTYLVNYTHRESALFRLDDREILGCYREDLRRLFPDAGGCIVDQFLFRAPYVEPIWTVGYRQLRPPTTILPGCLYLACTAQVYPHVNSWNSCCQVVEEMVRQIAVEAAA